MNLKKLNKFCAEFNIDPDSLEFFPGWKREIFITLTEDDWVRIVPQEENYASEKEFEEAKEQFQCDWFCFDGLDHSLNVY